MMTDFILESRDCDLNVLNDILENQGYIDDEDESEDVNSDHQKNIGSRIAADRSRTGRLMAARSREEDNLRKLEQERRRLELENEEIKRQVEELKRQEQLMEQGKEDYTRNNLKELAEKDDSDRESKLTLDSIAGSHEADDNLRDDLGEQEVESDDGDFDKSTHSGGDGDGRDLSPANASFRRHNSNENGSRNIRRRLSPDRRHRSGSRSLQNRKRRRERESSPHKAKRKHSMSDRHGNTRCRQPSVELSPKLQYIFQDAKYFLIKSSNYENVALAQAKGVWSSPPPNEMRINQAYRSHSNVILIFSVKESGKFQGFARVASESDRNHPPIRWVLPVGISARMLSGVFTLDWINRSELEFDRTIHVRNSFNDGAAVKIGRDGQEIDPMSGEEVCRMFPRDHHSDLDTIAMKARQALKLNGVALPEPQNRSPWNASDYRLDRHNRNDRIRERHDKDSRWNDRRNQSPGRRPYSSRYSRHTARENHQHDTRPDNFRGFRRKIGLPPLPPPGFMPPPVYGHIHPPPPPPPFMFDRFSRGHSTRHAANKRVGRHEEDDFSYRHARESRSHPYGRQSRDRR